MDLPIRRYLTPEFHNLSSGPVNAVWIVALGNLLVQEAR